MKFREYIEKFEELDEAKKKKGLPLAGPKNQADPPEKVKTGKPEHAPKPKESK